MPSIRASEEDTVTGHDTPERMLLWIDAVGGYLVCLDDYLVLGQPTPGQPIALPIMADLSRRHAAIRREGGAYVLEPIHATVVDDRTLTGPVVLNDRQVIQLGDGVKLRFRRPHALSSTATLKIESGHKTQPSADGVILLADSCVIGPNSHCHVDAPKWPHDVILYRQADRLMCRTAGQVTVNEAAARGPAAIEPGSRVEGDDFALTLEQA